MKDFKVKVPLIITGINVFAYLAPFVILLPLLLFHNAVLQDLESKIPGVICVIIFLIAFLVDLILIFLSPLMQMGLIFAAIINRKWWLLGIHIPFTILLCGGAYVFFSWFTNISV